MYNNTATFRHFDWPLHEAVGAPPFDAYITVSPSRPSFIFLPLLLWSHLSAPLLSNIRPPLYMCKKRNIHVHVHPPFPSFAWVMTAQANPPTQAHAYGYIRNARALHPRLLAHRTTPPGRHRPYARSSGSPPSPARANIEPCDERFMVGRSAMDFLVACGWRKLNTYPFTL
jgi:hypothetical protein